MSRNPFTATNDILIDHCVKIINDNDLMQPVPSRVLLTHIREKIAERLGMSHRELCEKVSGQKLATTPEPEETQGEELDLGGYILREGARYLAKTKDGSIAYTANPTDARVFTSLSYAVGFRKQPDWEVLKRISLKMERVDVSAYEKALSDYHKAKTELERFDNVD